MATRRCRAAPRARLLAADGGGRGLGGVVVLVRLDEGDQAAGEVGDDVRVGDGLEDALGAGGDAVLAPVVGRAARAEEGAVVEEDEGLAGEVLLADRAGEQVGAVVGALKHEMRRDARLHVNVRAVRAMTLATEWP